MGEIRTCPALVRHNQNLRLYGRCDADCGVPDCRAPYYDGSGLTRYRRPRPATSSTTEVDVRPNDKKEVRDAMTTPPSQKTDRPVFGQPATAAQGERR
jgi:hypothetical protein